MKLSETDTRVFTFSELLGALWLGLMVGVSSGAYLVLYVMGTM